MDAKAKPIREILYSDVQFVIPFFQRDYSWTRSNWERLKADIWSLLEEGPNKKHFLGPLVCSPLPLLPGDPVRFQLIDGQQRITTLSLLLAALRDVAEAEDQLDLAAEINETYLIHRFKKGIAKFKLLPRSGDRELFQKLIDKVKFREQNSTLCDGYQYFRKLLRNAVHHDQGKLRSIFEAVANRLYLVVISLDEEDPYEIFESLNSTGLPLEESDLVRNFLFMQIPLEEQADFQEECWKDFESQFEAEGDQHAIQPTAFYRDFLMRNGKYSKAKATFADFKEYCQQESLTPRAAVEQLREFVEYAQQIAGCNHPDKDIAVALKQFSAMDATTANPLLLNLASRFRAGSLAKSEYVGCLQDLTSFVLRRSICGETGRAYGRWFCELAGELGDSPREQLQGYLLHRGWPDDATLARWLVEFPIYPREFRKCRMILEAIEGSFGHKEAVRLDETLQIEHVMPQTLPGGKAGEDWRARLGANAKSDHKRLLHTIGNLTLTGYNPSLSNRAFGEKLRELEKSNLSINKQIVEIASWNAEIIENRSKTLAEVVAELWPRPSSDLVYVPVRVARQEVFRAGRERRAEYWQRFSKMLEAKSVPLRPVRPTDGTYTEIYMPMADVTLYVQYLRPKKQLIVQLRFARARGRQIYEALSSDRALLDSQMPSVPSWDSGDNPSITTTLDNVSLRDPLDWLEQHEWLSGTLADYHRVFYDRLVELHSLIKEKSEFKQFLLDYWIAFHKFLFEQQSPLLHNGARSLRWNDAAIGRSGVWMSAKIDPDDEQLSVSLILSNPSAEQFFPQLEALRADIDVELGEAAEWLDNVEGRRSRIRVASSGHEITNWDKWPEQHAWLYEKLSLFDRVFRERVAQLTIQDV